MRSLRGQPAASWLVLVLVSAFSSSILRAAQDTETIRPGESIAGEMHEESEDATFRVEGEPGTTVTAIVESLDFMPQLQWVDGDGAVLERAGMDELDADARLSFEIASDPAARLIIPRPSRLGSFELRLELGSKPAPVGAEGLRRAIEQRRLSRERGLAAEDVAWAVASGVREGDLRRKAGQAAPAEKVLLWAASAAEAARLHDRGGSAASVLGQLYLGLGRLQEALEQQRSALRLCRLAEDRRREGEALGNLGNVYYRLGDILRAREHYTMQRDLALELQDVGLEVFARGNLGTVQLRLREVGAAQAEYERARELLRTHPNPNFLASILGNLANLYHETGQATEARSALEEAAEVAHSIGDRNLIAQLETNLGRDDLARGDVDSARSRLEEAVRVSREIDNRNAESWALANLGLVFEDLGDYRKAESVYRERLSLALRIRSAIGEAWSYWQLGNVLRVQGRTGESRRMAQKALTSARELGDRSLELQSLQSLASVSLLLGRWRECEETLEASRALAEQARDIVGLSQAWRSQAMLALVRRQYAAARDSLERALEIDTRIERPARIAIVRRLLSRVELEAGRPEVARQHAKAGLELAREVRDRREEGLLLSSWAACELQFGNRETARGLAEQARRLVVSSDIPKDLLSPLSILAKCALASGEIASAEALLREAERAIDEPFSGLDVGQGELALARWYSSLPRLMHDTAAARLSLESSDEQRQQALSEAFESISRWKARSLLRGVVHQRRGGTSPEVAALRNERQVLATRLDRLSQRIDAGIRADWEAHRLDALRTLAEDLRKQEEDLTGRLRALSPQDADLESPPGVSIRVVQQRLLSKGDLLIDFVEGESDLYACVVSKGSAEFLTLGDHDAIEDAVEEFRSAIEELAAAPLIASLGRSLAGRLLSPCLDVVSDEEIGRLLILPCGVVASLPFDALVLPGEEEAPTTFADVHFVLDRFEVSYGPSVPVLMQLLDAGTRQAGGKMLLLADPIYPSESAEEPEASSTGSLGILGRGSSSIDVQAFQRLPHTRREALEIAGILVGLVEEDRELAAELLDVSRDRDAVLTGSSLELRLGREANPDVFGQDLEHYALVHIAAHGFVDPDSPPSSGLILSGGTDGDVFLSVEDILSAHLDANLVVLSACETARGEVVSGEGLQSLARAFLFAGSRSVIASQWMVADAGAADLMIAFYRNIFQKGMAPSRALVDAKRELRRSSRGRGVSRLAQVSGGEAVTLAHPFFWAPFIHVGLLSHE